MLPFDGLLADPRFSERGPLPLAQLFPPNTPVLFTAGMHNANFSYAHASLARNVQIPIGAVGVVVDVQPSGSLKVRLDQFSTHKNKMGDAVTRALATSKNVYHSQFNIIKELGIDMVVSTHPPSFLSTPDCVAAQILMKVTGRINITIDKDTTHDIGLNFRSGRLATARESAMKVPGYVSITMGPNGGYYWQFSDQAVREIFEVGSYAR